MLAILMLAAVRPPTAAPHLVAFVVSCPKDAYQGKQPVRAVVYLSQHARQPMYGPDWFHPEPCYSAKFTTFASASLMIESGVSVGFPNDVSKLPAGTYTVQAVVDRNLGGRVIATSPGNYTSDPITIKVDPKSSGPVTLDCDHLVAEPNLQDTDRLKFERFPSKLLTAFYRRPTYIKAVVALPSDYAPASDTKFPAVYEVPGFGGSADNEAEAKSMLNTTDKPGQGFVSVLLDPNVPTGHCVFADSANNGPWGTALIDEFIPYLEHKYRLIAEPRARFVTGHSSGGWSSLWLQVSHPDFFGGVWSTSPDPVDFTDFQMIDLYRKGENMFKDRAGHPRPLARDGDQILADYKSFSDMERPIRGEQLGSFEAVFSPRGKDGEPMKLWNRDTGKIDPQVAEAWKKYDIDLILKKHWAELGPKLAGKLHVYCGSEDTFYLDGAVRKLKSTLAGLHSDASVELMPGNHFTVLTPELRNRINREMVARFKARSAG